MPPTFCMPTKNPSHDKQAGHNTLQHAGPTTLKSKPLKQRVLRSQSKAMCQSTVCRWSSEADLIRNMSCWLTAASTLAVQSARSRQMPARTWLLIRIKGRHRGTPATNHPVIPRQTNKGHPSKGAATSQTRGSWPADLIRI